MGQGGGNALSLLADLPYFIIIRATPPMDTQEYSGTTINISSIYNF